MAMIRWEPFGAMDDLFDRMLPALYGRRLAAGAGAGQDGERSWMPSTDISETEQEYLIRAELPAVKKQDLHVTAEDGRLTIAGERRQESTSKDERVHRMESSYGSFMRSFALPDDVDAGAIRCESRDGVLTVHIPKKAQPKREARRIDVE
jgi:HSP20 family protein